MAYSAKAVANEFIRLAKEHGVPLSPMKLQKLVYFAHGWYLALTGQPLINERVEAWQYGPVIRELYQEFKRFGNSPISNAAKEFDWEDGFTSYEPSIGNCDDSDEQAHEIINRIWEVYGNYSAVRLSNVTHEPDSPWAQTYKEGSRSDVISDEIIEAYFRGLKDQHAE